MIDSKLDKKSNERHKGNKILNVLIIFVMSIAIQIPVGISLVALPLSLRLNDWYTIAISMLTLGIALLIVWGVRSYYLHRTYEYQHYKMRARDILINLGFFLLVIMCSISANLLMLYFTGDTNTENEKTIDESLSSLVDKSHLPHPTIVLVTVLCICFIGPYLEELVFRGIFKETLFMKSRFWLPLIISSMVFSSQHLSSNIFSYGLYFLMGCALYITYNRRRNLKDSMMVHMLNNSLTTIPIFIGYLYFYFK
ncbi:type II CAAX endopeptidase family protein [Staphylococcus caprae]|uniref:Abortive infection family protein n=2 Tax=Staphylococcus TaxID=1279 RepID=A0ABM7FN51_9STAP|nr:MULTISPECIES: type II CAAX endopeptidase family protein [Staphylococcus]EES41721.1 CAAX amino terminal protease family protein [Staphylococcus caprae M23864:W1]MBN6826295.1 CPBP family intramembrane metalloprotease [Staphylococcus caprae]MBU5272068.1 CPBP family intramembrane metalloprotease [Staphylococcus caprae]MBX5317089.1 CPBP family intramembrane metalloprotease [Staphylococcus caprae]MBX5323505.1 CPBP family intramembrane metalloprotease [Staphylococcus caprae]